MNSLSRASQFRAFTTAVLLLVGASQYGVAQRYIEFDAPGSAGTTPLSMNSGGSMAGYFYDSQISFHGFVRDPAGNITTFDEPDAAQGAYLGTFAVAVNDSGEIAGYYTPLSNPSSYQGFVRDSSGNFTSIGIPGILTAEVLALNSAGQTAGCAAQGPYCLLYGGDGQGFVRDSSGSVFTFLPKNATTVAPEAINTTATVTGEYADSNSEIHGFVLAPGGQITEFDMPAFKGPGVGTFPHAINDNNVIIGWYNDPTVGTRGFIREANGKLMSFHVPGTNIATYPVAINSAGTITGSYSDVPYHGFVRDPLGNITTFDAPRASQRPGYGTQPVGITPTGVIAGFYWDATGATHGFLRIR